MFVANDEKPPELTDFVAGELEGSRGALTPWHGSVFEIYTEKPDEWHSNTRQGYLRSALGTPSDLS